MFLIRLVEGIVLAVESVFLFMGVTIMLFPVVRGRGIEALVCGMVFPITVGLNSCKIMYAFLFKYFTHDGRYVIHKYSFTHVNNFTYVIHLQKKNDIGCLPVSFLKL